MKKIMETMQITINGIASSVNPGDADWSSCAGAVLDIYCKSKLLFILSAVYF
jgi:hypothetical protein